MLRFFRLNDPYRLLFVLLITLALGIKAEFDYPGVTTVELHETAVGEMLASGKRMYSSVWHSLPPLAAYAQKVMHQLFERSTQGRHIITWLLIFFQAAYFSVVLIRNRAFNESNYLPALLMAVIAFFSFDTVSFSQEILGSTVLLLALNNLFEEIEFKKQRDETIHNLGLYLSLAGLCVFSYIFFFLCTVILLFIYTRVEWRRFLLFLVGFIWPHALLITHYVWHNEAHLLWQNFYAAHLQWQTHAWLSTTSFWVLTALPLTYLFFSLIMARRDARLTKYQSQIFQVMVFWLITAILQIVFSQERTPQSFLVCLPPAAYFINHYLLLINRKWLAETMLWLLIVGTITIASLAARNNISVVDYSPLLAKQVNEKVSNRKVLILADAPGYWLTNKPAGIFLEWRLAESVLKQPEYYQHVLAVADNFQNDAPELIYDPKNYLTPFIKHLPKFYQQYSRDGDWWKRVVR